MRKCKSCHCVKPLEDFHRNINSSEGRLHKCKDCVNSHAKDFREIYPHKRIMTKYGVEEDLAKILAECRTCDICGQTERRTVVDHCHTTGEVRGKLCDDCNLGLGRFKDNPSFLTLAASYISSFNAYMGESNG